jgi:hypothetical protein
MSDRSSTPIPEGAVPPTVLCDIELTVDAKLLRHLALACDEYQAFYTNAWSDGPVPDNVKDTIKAMRAIAEHFYKVADEANSTIREQRKAPDHAPGK